MEKNLEIKMIDGTLFEKMMYAAINNLHDNVKVVNDLNVFPIPDGDTGENMYLTLKGGVDELRRCDNEDLDEKAMALARGMLLGARGNSGVILSQLFHGISLGLRGLKTASILDFNKALEQGVKCAYKSVAEPVEGTILTVARESVENSSDKLHDGTTPEQYFNLVFNEMKKSLENTPELLHVLKEAGVIDSGGAGLLFITEGFCKVISGAEVKYEDGGYRANVKSIDFSLFDENSVMEFGYCTEVLLRLQKSKVDVENFDVKDITSYLDTIGDSIVAVKTESIVKIHVHTLEPWKVLAYCQKFGEYLTTKIENMTLQHNETEIKKEEEKSILPTVKKERTKYATITVLNGEGLIDTFKEMGVDYVINGGQTNNPSSEEFLKAFEAVNADNIFVLPNNSNIILTAKQAGNIYKDSNIIVIETKNIGQGYSAISMLDYSSDDVNEITNNLIESYQDVVTGMVAKSVRTTTVNGVNIEKDDYMGFSDKTMLVSTKSKVETTCELCEKLEANEKSFLIVVYGASVTLDEKEEVRNHINSKYSNLEFYEIDGGQDIYDFLLIIE